MQEPKKLENAKVCMEVKHSLACHRNPIKIKSCKDPFLSLVPLRRTLLHFPRWQGRAVRAFWNPQGHTIGPHSSWMCTKSGSEGRYKGEKDAMKPNKMPGTSLEARAQETLCNLRRKVSVVKNKFQELERLYTHPKGDWKATPAHGHTAPQQEVSSSYVTGSY